MLIDALINIYNNKFKYLLVFILLFFIITITIISIVINTATNIVINDYMDKYGSYVTIKKHQKSDIFNLDTPKSEYNNLNTDERLTSQEYKYYGNSDYVEEISYQGTGYLTATYQNQLYGYISNYNIQITGTDNFDSINNFLLGKTKLTNGRMPKYNKEIIINEEISNIYNLNINDYINLTNGENEYKFHIVGIYSDGNKAYYNENLIASYPIYSNYNTVKSIFKNDLKITATYKLNNYKNLDNYQKELYDKGLSSDYMLDNNVNFLEQLIKPLENFYLVSKQILLIVVLIGTLILIGVNILMLKNNKTKYCFLILYGISKRKIVLTNLLEKIIVSIFSIFVSLIGAILFIPIVINYFLSLITMPVSLSLLPNSNVFINVSSILQILIVVISIILVILISSSIYIGQLSEKENFK